mmetsp:Transcript_98483/g.155229  ORF Transcript_98483/g.155229 Transcript_98483/m.155229 type:complete len:367 (-) Transcript_98483:74-1174(-)
MLRRLMGGRNSSRSSADLDRKRLPNLSEDDDGALLYDEKVRVVGRAHCHPSPGSSTTASMTTYSTGTRSPPESSSSGDNEELRSAFRNPLSHLMGTRSGATSKPLRGSGARSESDEDGAGLGFSRAVGSSACCPSSEDVVTFSIFRSPLFARDGREEKLEVEISRALTIAGLRQQIAELYGIPEASQRLQRTPDLGGDRLRSTTSLEELVHQPIFLLPADVTLEDSAIGIDHGNAGYRKAAEDEQAAMVRGMMESLQGVKYKVHVTLPEEFNSKGASRSLSLDALARVGDVQIMLEMELTGAVGKLPMMMVFNGQALPPEIPLHFAGICDESTLSLVVVDLAFAREPGWNDEDDFEDDPVLSWVAR